AEDGIRDRNVTGVQTCALPISGALQLAEIPKHFLAIGGSAIGLEFADIYGAFGSEVTVVELLDHIVPTIDDDVAAELVKALAERSEERRVGKEGRGQRGRECER